MFTIDNVVVTEHARTQMLTRAIALDEVLVVMNTGETIEDYPTDTPYPSRLTLGVVASRVLHVTWASGPDGVGIVITAYEPDDRWWPGARQRRKP